MGVFMASVANKENVPFFVQALRADSPPPKKGGEGLLMMYRQRRRNYITQGPSGTYTLDLITTIHPSIHPTIREMQPFC